MKHSTRRRELEKKPFYYLSPQRRLPHLFSTQGREPFWAGITSEHQALPLYALPFSPQPPTSLNPLCVFGLLCYIKRTRSNRAAMETEHQAPSHGHRVFFFTWWPTAAVNPKTQINRHAHFNNHRDLSTRRSTAASTVTNT